MRPIAHVVPLFLLGCLLPCLRCADKHRSSSGSGRAQNALTSIGVPAEAERLNTRFPSASVSKGSSPPNLSDPSACRCSEYLKPRKRNRTQLRGDLDFCLNKLEIQTKSKLAPKRMREHGFAVEFPTAMITTRGVHIWREASLLSTLPQVFESGWGKVGHGSQSQSSSMCVSREWRSIESASHIKA